MTSKQNSQLAMAPKSTTGNAVSNLGYDAAQEFRKNTQKNMDVVQKIGRNVRRMQL